MPKWMEEGVSKAKPGSACKNPDDRGSKEHPMRHYPAGVQNTDRNNPHGGKGHKGHKSR